MWILLFGTLAYLLGVFFFLAICNAARRGESDLPEEWQKGGEEAGPPARAPVPEAVSATPRVPDPPPSPLRAPRTEPSLTAIPATRAEPPMAPDPSLPHAPTPPATVSPSASKQGAPKADTSRKRQATGRDPAYVSEDAD